ncbi:MAG: EAL domain-containing protein [Oscillospiraceae bacterium]|nr:EAL domain-containing protein [Oscillospiraceae bacterium]
MPDKKEQFNAANARRLVLVADDELINRELLGNMLEDTYDVLFAENGAEAIAAIREHRDALSIVLLDLIMPEMSGMDILRAMRGDAELQSIPVIVCTSDNSAEVECLLLGAIDFISKPYDQPEVILARIRRTIELCEDRQIIRDTEKDSLTGLYTREYFYRYAEQFDQLNREVPTDAVYLDVNHFHILNERYGRAYGDEVLRRLGENLTEATLNGAGIVCRRQADTFMIYCPHREDHSPLLELASRGLSGDDSGTASRVRLRMGIYPMTDRSIDIERRFDRAKMAADTIRNNYSQAIAIYDNTLHQTELYSEQLLEEFPEAIAQRQFKVYYQPKFDIRSEIPSLSSAEALVRWQHPTMGLISPGVFIPLFESNSLIQQLDLYVWREAASQVRHWREKFGISVPVSVNVSRIDMYDPGLIDTFRGILEDYSISPSELLLEITESAYTQNSAQIIETVNELRSLGFRIEMDDFGTGYSSLSMISSLPIDALKLDMRFIRNAFSQRRDIRMLELIIDIAEYLGVPTIAEGVETEDQLEALRDMGCDIVQGYYFSKPVPPEEYEHFMAEEKVRRDEPAPAPSLPKRTRDKYVSYANIAHALSSGFENIYYVDTLTDHFVEFSPRGKPDDLQIERGGGDFFDVIRRSVVSSLHPEDRERVTACLEKRALLSQLLGDSSFSITYRVMENGAPVYYNLKAVRAGGQDDHHMVVGISNVDDLTRQAISYQEARARSTEFFNIAQALSGEFESIYYVNTKTGDYTEFTANGTYDKLQIEKTGTGFFEECVKNIQTVVYADDRSLVSAALTKEALSAFGETRTIDYRLMIDGSPVYYRMKIMNTVSGDREHVVIGVCNIASQMSRELELAEARELAFKDALTGIKNTRSYVQSEQQLNGEIERGDCRPFSVVVCDINDLKGVNDTKGHKAGDRYIKDACALICRIFAHSPVFRVGGDEFTVILSGRDYEHREKLMEELRTVCAENRKTGAVTVAGGISDYIPGKDSCVADVFGRADSDMYANKAAVKRG